MYLRFFFLELYMGYSPFFFFFLLHGVSLIFERSVRKSGQEKLVQGSKRGGENATMRVYTHMHRISAASHVRVDRCHRYSSRHGVISTRLAICDINRLVPPPVIHHHCPIKPAPSFQSYYSFDGSILDSDRLGKLNFSRGS